jgi:hypothetical protein
MTAMFTRKRINTNTTKKKKMINLQRQEATESKHRSPLHIEQKNKK